MPSPEQLGISGGPGAPGKAPAAVARVDWNDLRARLDRLGSLGFHVDKLSSGTFRVAVVLPTGQPDRNHRVEVTAETEAGAAQLALQRAEAWVGQRH
jgi:hypothetical protein